MVRTYTFKRNDTRFQIKIQVLVPEATLVTNFMATRTRRRDDDDDEQGSCQRALRKITNILPVTQS